MNIRGLRQYYILDDYSQVKSNIRISNMNLNDRNIIPPELLNQYYDDDKIEFRRQLSEIEKTRGKVGRNAKCPCGSGKKLKHCCLKRN